MKITLGRLRRTITEALYHASAPKRFNLPDLEIEADDTRDAGEKASLKWNAGVDPFTVSVSQIEKNEMSGKHPWPTGTFVRINDIDMYGFTGRNHHPKKAHKNMIGMIEHPSSVGVPGFLSGKRVYALVFSRGGDTTKGWVNQDDVVDDNDMIMYYVHIASGGPGLEGVFEFVDYELELF